MLEDHPVVLVHPGLVGRLAEDLDRSRRRLEQVADEAEEGRLATPRGADQGDELSGCDGEVDSGKGRDLFGAAPAEDLLDFRDDYGVIVHVEASLVLPTNIRSASVMRPKTERPRAAAPITEA